MNELLMKIFQDKDGFILHNMLTDKDKKKIAKITGDSSMKDVVAFKDTSTLFKTQGYVFTLKKAYSIKAKANLVGLEKFEYRESNTFEYQYKGDVAKTIQLDEEFGKYVQMYVCFLNGLYQKGNKCFLEDDYESAAEYFEAICSYNLYNTYTSLAMCYELDDNIKDVDRAIQLYRQSFPYNDPNLQTTKDLIEYGDKCYDMGKYLLSYVCYEEALDMFDPEGAYKLGNLYYDGKGVKCDYKRALEFYREALEYESYNEKYLVKAALAALLLGDYDKVENYLYDVETADKYRLLGIIYKFGDIHKNLKNDFNYKKDLRKSLEYFEKAASMDNYNYDLCIEIARCLKDYDKCYEYANKMYQLGDISALYMIGEAYEYGRGVPRSLRKAHDYYKEGYDKKDYACACRLARMYRDGNYETRNVEKAIKIFEECIENGYIEAYKELALVYRKNGKWKDLKKYCDYLELGHKNEDVEASLMFADFWKSDPYMACPIYEEAMRFELGHDVRKSFMSYIIKHDLEIPMSNVEDYFICLWDDAYDDSEYRNLYKKFLEHLTHKCFDKYIYAYKSKYPKTSSKERACVYFFEVYDKYYFLDISTCQFVVVYEDTAQYCIENMRKLYCIGNWYFQPGMIFTYKKWDGVVEHIDYVDLII